MASGRKRSTLVALSLLAALAAACSVPPTTPTVIRGETMGTYYAVTLAEGSIAAEEVDALQAVIDERLELVNDQMSTYRPDSELSRFNAAPAGEWVEVSLETAAVGLRSIQIGEETGGAFDVTVGGLVDLWSFGPEARPREVPDRDAVERLLAAVGPGTFEARLAPPALRKTDDAVAVDLSGIAKGHGVDAVAELLKERGLGNHLVDIGGEMRAGGEKLPGLGWSIAIERPGTGPREIEQLLELSNVAVATSGDYRNYFEQDGRRYSHTIDPRTGSPIVHRLASVTVLDDNCTTADALATALMVLGPDGGYTFAERHGIAALLLVRDADGFTSRATPAFEARTAARETP